jgi:hypothetical protein
MCLGLEASFWIQRLDYTWQRRTEQGVRVALRRRVVVGSLAVFALNSGCLSYFTYTEYDHFPIEAAWVGLVEAAPNHLEMVVGTEYEGSPKKESKIEFDPRLDRCDSVNVLARTQRGHHLLIPGARYSLPIEAGENHRERSDTRDMADGCTIGFFFSAYQGSLALSADTIRRHVGQGDIHSPKNFVALAVLMPAAIVADVATAPISLVLFCITSSECGRSVLEDLDTTDSGEGPPWEDW